MRAEVFHADRRADMTTLTVAFRKFCERALRARRKQENEFIRKRTRKEGTNSKKRELTCGESKCRQSSAALSGYGMGEFGSIFTKKQNLFPSPLRPHRVFETHPASCPMDSRPFPGGKRSELKTDNLRSFSDQVNIRYASTYQSTASCVSVSRYRRQ